MREASKGFCCVKQLYGSRLTRLPGRGTLHARMRSRGVPPLPLHCRGDEEADDNSKQAAEMTANHFLATLPCCSSRLEVLRVGARLRCFTLPIALSSEASAHLCNLACIVVVTLNLPFHFHPRRPPCSACAWRAPPPHPPSSCRCFRMAGRRCSGCGAWCGCRGCTTCMA